MNFYEDLKNIGTSGQGSEFSISCTGYHVVAELLFSSSNQTHGLFVCLVFEMDFREIKILLQNPFPEFGCGKEA